MVVILQKQINEKRKDDNIFNSDQKRQRFVKKINTYFDEVESVNIEEDFPIKLITKKKTLGGKMK